MDHQFNNSPNEFLGKLLANPASDVSSYFNHLQQLVDDYPQSGILQALLVCSAHEKNLKQAAAYYNPRLLFELVSDPLSLPGVADERIIIEKSLRSKYPEQANGHSTEPALGLTAINGENDTSIIENYFSDPAAELVDGSYERESNGDKPEIYPDGDSYLTSAKQSGSELPVLYDENLNGLNAFTSNQSEVNNINAEKNVEENVNVQVMLPSLPAEDVSGTVTDDVSEITNADPDEQIVVAENTAAASNDSESAGLLTANDYNVTENGEPDKNSDPAETLVLSTDTYSNDNLLPQAGDIDDEVFDEILGIEYINISPEQTKQTPGAVIDPEPDKEESNEQLALYDVQADNFFTIETSLDDRRETEFTEEKLSNNVQATIDVPIEAPPADNEQQDVSKYNDDKMPYTFMWWLEKTRQQHSGIFQPYIKPDHSEVSAVPEQKTDELQQQYYENIFHITSIEEVEKNIPHPPFAAVPKRKEQVIIERFIKEEPQIRPQSSDKLDNENKAKKSAEDKDELVTETLANIYSDQMLYHKAIASYKKLILKFPEKSSYFADKIALLEKKIN